VLALVDDRSTTEPRPGWREACKACQGSSKAAGHRSTRDEDVNVQLEDSVLTISGERKTEQHNEQEGYYRLERAFGRFSRSLTLPDEIEPERIQAHLDRGVLEITIPKPEQKKPRKVQIKLGASEEPKTIEGAAADPKANSRDPVAAVA
jgi:hypothetical protein